MSTQGLHFQIQKGLASNSRLSAVYDFSDSSEVTFVGAGSDYTGIIPNSSFSNNDSNHTGFLLGALGSTQAIALSRAYDILDQNKLPLNSGNFKVPLDGLNSNDLSAIIDFEFNDTVSNGILMGCFEKGSETIESIAFENSKGFNIGVTDRGHLFCQTFGPEGDSVDVITDIELSKRNLIGFSVSNDSISLSDFDYFNNIVRSVDIPISEDYISQTGDLFFGGSNSYFASSSAEDTTFDGSLHSLSIFSGYFGPEYLKELSEGMLGEYEYTAPVETQFQRLTGYDETIVYKTGITGYDYESTGTLSIVTGREYVTGSFSLDSSSQKKEGERYYKDYTLNNGDSKTFYKEELGKLHSNSGYVYYPTGENAYDTLGLNDVSESIQTYTEISGIEQDTITIDLYGKTPLTGVLSEISGVSRTDLEETYSTFTLASSGILLSGDSEALKKNFIYYMGDRS